MLSNFKKIMVMTYKQILSKILRITILGLFGYFIYSVHGIWAILIVFAILLFVGFFYFLAMCIAAGLDNKFGEFDRYMWERKEPKQLPVSHKLLPCK